MTTSAKPQIFGIRLHLDYLEKVKTNRKVNRKIRERLNYYRKLGTPKTVREVIELLHNNPLWHTRLLSQSDRSWEAHLAR